MIRRLRCLTLLTILQLSLTACSDQRSTASDPGDSAPPAADTPAADTPGVGAADAPVAQETWMSCSIEGSKMGYMHFRQTPFQEAGKLWIRLQHEDRLTISRFGTETVVETRLTSEESPDGRVRSFDLALKAGPTAMQARGRVEGQRLVIEETTEGQTQQRTMDFPLNCGGFFADQLSLSRDPMQPGETRRLKALVPIALTIADVTLQAKQLEAVSLPSGTRQLLNITVTTDMGTSKLASTVWADPEGKVWKTRDQSLNLEAVVTSREEALARGTPSAFDLGMDTVVRVAKPLPRPHETRQVRYRAVVPEGDIGSLFPTGLSQQVLRVDDRTAEITVLAVRPDDPPEVPRDVDTAPTEANRRGSPLLQTQDPRVIALANEVAAEPEDPWGLACGLEKHVRERVQQKNYGTAMATAAEVARTLEGDCTEHAMLLAALCRVRGIPSRVAIGLVYYPAAQGFAYHMWTEAWIRDRWIPLDATLGRGGIGAAHLKLADSAMGGMEAFAELLPIIRAIGRLKLELLAIE
jgi:hypothetical protein